MADRSFLNWPFFDESHRVLADKVADWSDDALAPLIEAEHAAGSDPAAIDAVAREMVGALGAGGWLRYCVPASHGGVFEALDVRSLCLIREALAARSGLADLCFVMQGLGTGAITLFGDGARKAAFLSGIAEGARIAAFAISEPDAGSDVAAISTAARRDGDAYAIDGIKTWISNAGLADQYVVFARTGEAPGRSGLSAFVVPADAPGLSVTERIPTCAAHPLGTVRFDSCRVPASNLIGMAGDGFKVAMATLDTFRPTVGAAALGFARRALDEALAHSAGRSVGGRKLAEYQMTQAAIADMAVSVDASALLVYRAAWTKDATGARTSREASMAKLFATEAAQQVIDRTVQLLGGLGVVSGGVAERLYREIRPLRIYEGASEVQKLIVAGQTRAAFEASREGAA